MTRVNVDHGLRGCGQWAYTECGFSGINGRILATMQIWYPLFLILAANAAPIMAWRVSGRHLAWPVDGGLRLPDGRRLFGPSKTLRGIVAAVLAGTAAAALTGIPWPVGAAVGLGAMAGDLLSSFVKRRLGLTPSAMAPGLDQVPESLIPLFLVRQPLGLEAIEIAATVAAFLVVDLIFSRLACWMRVRKNPY